jgi:hypothetical protein
VDSQACQETSSILYLFCKVFIYTLFCHHKNTEIILTVSFPTVLTIYNALLASIRDYFLKNFDFTKIVAKKTLNYEALVSRVPSDFWHFFAVRLTSSIS